MNNIKRTSYQWICIFTASVLSVGCNSPTPDTARDKAGTGQPKISVGSSMAVDMDIGSIRDDAGQWEEARVKAIEYASKAGTVAKGVSMMSIGATGFIVRMDTSKGVITVVAEQFYKDDGEVYWKVSPFDQGARKFASIALKKESYESAYGAGVDEGHSSDEDYPTDDR